jgi:Fur family transcriptional regulator, peroxide stress response regulator
MMSTLEQLTSTLKKAGMRLTPQRLSICKLLGDTNAHPTAAAIYQQIRVQYPSLSLMTVYNTLNRLVELGAVNALGNAGDDNVHYDGNTSPHINLACISCHKIIDVASRKVADLDGEVSRASGFKLFGARMLFYGLCPDCQKSTIQ